MPGRPAEPKLHLRTAREWHQWLKKNHEQPTGVLLLIAKKNSGGEAPTMFEALDACLCWGWIDSVKYAHDDQYYAQRYSRRKPTSPGSVINQKRVEQLLIEGLIQPPGMKEIEKAKANGSWARAYGSSKNSTVPPDLQKALDAAPRAKAFFEKLNSNNRYAILFRLQIARTEKTRLARLEKFMAMLKARQTMYPQKGL